ncbi:hypothetical protein M011DRAFT_464889 [Sporormia fimetaria CBS 119925]|uniref:Uncharacterized protein n=1 Tax=Sporormia fimetaria CBS 119925 TaxID=1340428 RepID=A0A6A6VKL7_9PLEO|nr:hypothetical protein M011DRAFT_464889 [Sporormia fimetaria CBS 119925]
MPPFPRSDPYIRIPAVLFGLIFLGFGTNMLLRPEPAFTASFGFPWPTASTSATTKGLSTADHSVALTAFCQMFGAKEVFEGVALLTTAWWGNKRHLGIVMFVAGLGAGVDGWVVKGTVGEGEWGHWGYGAVLFALGALGLV